MTRNVHSYVSCVNGADADISFTAMRVTSASRPALDDRAVSLSSLSASEPHKLANVWRQEISLGDQHGASSSRRAMAIAPIRTPDSVRDWAMTRCHLESATASGSSARDWSVLAIQAKAR